MAICPKCKQQLSDGTKFCKYCGTPLAHVNAQRPMQNNVQRPPMQGNSNVQRPVGMPAQRPMQASPQRPVQNNMQKPVPNNMNRPAKSGKNKKKKAIIISIVAFLLIAAIVCGIIFIPGIIENQKKKKTIEKITEVLETTTKAPIVDIVCEDYDQNGTYEAYAITGKTDDKKDDDKEEYSEFYEAEIYYVTEEDAKLIKKDVRGIVNGTVKTKDKIFVSIELFLDGKDEGYSYIYTVEDDKPAENEDSGKYSNVHEEDGKIYAEDENGKETEIDLDGKNTVIKPEEVPEEENKGENEKEDESVVPFDALPIYKSSLNNGLLDSYVVDEYGFFSRAGETECILVDINGDGIDELYVSAVDTSISGVRGYPSVDIIFAIQNGKVVNLAEATSGGGSIGGEGLILSSNPSTGKTFAFKMSTYRDGAFANITRHEVYSYDGTTLKIGTILETEYTSYSSEIERIKIETDLYTTEYDGVRCYSIDGSYISDQEYAKLLEDYGMDYERITDKSQFNIIKGTYENPLP